MKCQNEKINYPITSKNLFQSDSLNGYDISSFFRLFFDTC